MKKNLLLAATALLLSIPFGLRDAPAQAAAEESAPKVEVGVFFTSLTLTEPQFSFSETQPGIGGRFTYNLTDNIALEAESNIQAGRGRTSSVGGDTWQGQFGIKAGKRYKHFGIFAKGRPGFVSFGDVGEVVGFTQVTDPTGTFFIPQIRFERRTHFSMDVGGVLEFYPSRRIVTRFDIGDTIIRYGSRTSVLIDPTTQTPTNFTIPGKLQHNFQFSAGVGFRF
jgi:hypothetical protein